MCSPNLEDAENRKFGPKYQARDEWNQGFSSIQKRGFRPPVAVAYEHLSPWIFLKNFGFLLDYKFCIALSERRTREVNQ
jgi:hypothetical protein